MLVNGVSSPPSQPRRQADLGDSPMLEAEHGEVSEQVRASLDVSVAAARPGDRGDSSDAIRRLITDIMLIIGPSQRE